MKELESLHFDPTAVPTPCYIVDEARLRRNLELLQRVQQRSGAMQPFSLVLFLIKN